MLKGLLVVLRVTSKTLFGIAIVVILIIFGVKSVKKTEKNIKIAFSSAWKSIHPGLQSTFVADMVLSNQFESLVGYNENGSFVPLGAKSWTVNEDFTVFEFTIDTSRKYSDGTFLSAKDYKKSWEESLVLQPKSTNNALLDVLYKLKGFEEFEAKQQIPGIVVVNDQTLRLEFKSPFRMALEHLTGSRFSAFKKNADNFLGTGVFVIKEVSDKELSLGPNEYYMPRAENTISLTWDTIEHLQEKFRKGEIDVIHQTSGQGVNDQFFNVPNLVVHVGAESRHWVVELNKNTIFAKKENRQAFEYLVHKWLKGKKPTQVKDKLIALDSQVILPFQKGRLSEEFVDSIIESHAKHVDNFVAELNKSEGLFLIEVPMQGIKSILSDLNLKVSPKSYDIDIKQNAETRHKNNEYDVFPTTISVVSGDPDGLYHVFGKNGAIASKYSVDSKVAESLEIGRDIIKTEDVDKHYQEVARLMLTEVPMIHIGFTKSISFYRNDKVEVSNHVIKRNDGHLDIYELK